VDKINYALRKAKSPRTTSVCTNAQFVSMLMATCKMINYNCLSSHIFSTSFLW